MTDLDLPVPSPEPLPVAVVDSHCHLDIMTEYSGLDVERALAAAAGVGVSGVVQVGIDIPSSRACVEMAERHDRVVGAVVGIHPNEAPLRFDAGGWDSDLRALVELADHRAVIGIGETGLDHFRTEPAGRGAQRDAFAEQIRLARDKDLTLVIHDRDAHAEVLDVLEDVGAPARVVFHCFSGDSAMAKVVADAGWFLSFAGVVTFKNAAGLRDALQVAPPEQVLVETDAPFLTPTPHRGRPNASYLMPWTVRTMARVLGMEVADMGHVLAANTLRAFPRVRERRG